MIVENEQAGGRPEEAAGDERRFRVTLTVHDALGVRVFHHEAGVESWRYETTESGELVFRFREAKS